jgi:hypothetical protein
MVSFWSTMPRELLDRQRWVTRADLGSAIFEWIETFYNPADAIRARLPQSRVVRGASHRRTHRGMITQPDVSGEPGQAPRPFHSTTEGL